MEAKQEAQAREAREEESDMDMMLHERLREAEGIGDLQYIVGCESDEEYEIYTALANEIERYYIPRPCDDKGEPWKVEDPCIAKGEEGTVAGFDGEDFINVCGNKPRAYFWCDKRYVKRPTPKVYDADGVEIKVGDTVWFANSGAERTVKSLRQHDDGGYEIEFTNSLYCSSPDQLTHERPVFDADGVRICKGDEGWSCLTGKKLTPVIGFTEDKFGIKVELEDGYWIKPINFTHREPDSLEKLRDEISEAVESWGVDDFDWRLARKWSDRLTSLIERGA